MSAMPAPCATPERALADEFGITLEGGAIDPRGGLNAPIGHAGRAAGARETAAD
jgi:hypothetical protein